MFCRETVKLAVLVFSLSVILISSGYSVATNGGDQDYELEIRMPSVVHDVPDSLLCTGLELQPDESYIVKFTPHASRLTAHHMMVYGCSSPASHSTSWICNQSEQVQSENSVCRHGETRQTLFAWALDAPSKTLPHGVGFRVGGTTRVKYIVIQVHYARSFAEGESDNSGVTLHMTQMRPPMQMGYYILAHTGQVEPGKEEAHLEMACTYRGEQAIYPIGYRTHSHDLGVVTAGYRIRDGVWTEIGRMSPQLPQTFYNISTPGIDIRNGDVLAARCTMNTISRKFATQMGPTHHDEMCNFYIMYATDRQDDLTTGFCLPKTSDFTWSTGIRELLPPPPDVSSLEGISGSDYVRSKFHVSTDKYRVHA